MHLMIFDPHDRGHYLTYVRYLLAGADCAERVTLVLREGATGSAAFRTQLAPGLGRETIACSIHATSYRESSRLFADFTSACERHRPDHIWVPNADVLARRCNVAHSVGGFRLPSGTEAECGLVDLRFHRQPRRWRGYVRQFLDRSVFSAGPWARRHTIDPTLWTWLSTQKPRLARRFSLVPDPVAPFTPVSKTDARRAIGLPEDGRYVGAVGSHGIPRKGTGLLLDAFARAGLPETDRLLLAGPLGDDLRNRLRSDFGGLSKIGRVAVLDRYLEDEEVMMSLSAMDVVCTPYIDHWGSSGIVLRAAQAERPVLAPQHGWFGDVIPRFRLGRADDISEVGLLAAALRRTLDESGEFRVSSASRRLIQYSSAENFARLWAERLRCKLNLGPREDARTWEWVLQADR